jgi:hypothetical protein
MIPKVLLNISVLLALAIVVSAAAFAQTPARGSGQATRGTAPPAARGTAPGDARETNLRAYIELLRSDLRSQKVAVITEVMQFDEAEDLKFWPIYREYETALARINDDRMALIKEYAGTFDVLTDQTADRMAQRALELEERRHELKTDYYKKFKSALTPKTAARFLQVENQILLIMDLQIAASLPIASR